MKRTNISKKIGEIPIHRFSQQLSLYDSLCVFDAVSFYPSAMSDEKSNNPKIENGFAYKTDMNDEIVKKFNEVLFTRGSGIFTIKGYNLKSLIVQHIPVKEKN